MSVTHFLSPSEWASLLLGDASPQGVASQLDKGEVLPWAKLLLELTSPGDRILDLGSGRGDHGGFLALHGREVTSLDWSHRNLGFSAALTTELGTRGSFVQADMTHALPFRTGSFDVVFSCGVLEYFTRNVMSAICSEALRLSTKRVVILIPNAWSIPYRIGKAYMERTGQWPWGNETPAYSLRAVFKASAKRLRVQQFSVSARHSLEFLTMPGGGPVRRLLKRVFPPDCYARAPLRQGYLLVAIADLQ